ncbi:MAG TPA: DNA translocase FtsK 4TM domain-containing protein, partial [Candidatus Saccharimonadales bacterium]|nr:DNA translocase FtsK 4TM domain-containing protein [Candidatus Saccharimonadales bacterium]
MPKKRKTSRKVAKNLAPQHTLPSGFWLQVGAVILGVVALLLIIAMFGTGGPVLAWLLMVSKMLLGWSVYLVPVLLVYIAFETFRAEENRLPFVTQLATWLFVIWIAGFLQLFIKDPTNYEQSIHGSGGGAAGWVVNQAMLAMVSPRVAGFIFIILAFITSLFILRVTPKAIFDALKNMFTREMDVDANNAAIAQKANQLDGKKSTMIGELKLNEGVPTTQTYDDKPSKLSSLRDSIKTDKLAEDQSALITSSDPDWVPPSPDLLEKKQSPADAGDVKHNAQTIKDTLGEFNIDVEMEGANIGPKVTQYTLKPPSGVKLTRITALETNIALNLAAQALRIEAPIPGQRAVGIEVPNRKAADVRLYGILTSKQWQAANTPLSFAIGKDIAGEAVIGELDKMPHLLIAGQTGSGKSVMINTLLTSLLYRNNPSQMKLILVDPKQVEMAPYQDIPHLLTPVITEPEKTISALKWAVNEMERRYKLLADEKLRDVKSYNQHKKEEAMPYIVIVIDELADLMMVAARDVEALVVRLAQKARAVGIHLVLATQRPSVDVITGLIKANVPARIAFTVASQ